MEISVDQVSIQQVFATSAKAYLIFGHVLPSCSFHSINLPSRVGLALAWVSYRLHAEALGCLRQKDYCPTL
jgi:hypothetical protein